MTPQTSPQPTDEERWDADEDAHPAPMRPPHALGSDGDGDGDDPGTCRYCGGVLGFVGVLGNYNWYKCRHCGLEHRERSQL